MSNFYTHFTRDGGWILLREVAGDKRISRRVKFSPKVYVPARNAAEASGFTSIDGIPLQENVFNDMFVAAQYCKDNPDAYGNTRHEYAFIDEEYGVDMPYDVDRVESATLDIEVCEVDEFPNIEQGNQSITSFCLGHRGTYYIFGMKDYKPKPDEVFKKFSNEKDMILAFIKQFRAIDPDVITGWFIYGFDIPYIINRCRAIGLGEEVKKLSPWGKIRESEKLNKQSGEKEIYYDLVGVSILDGLDLYKKFCPDVRESYRLGDIAEIELGRTKVEYEGSLYELFRDNYQLGIEYNRVDVELVEKILDKMKLLSLAYTIAYWCRVNYNDIFQQIRLWDTMMTNYLRRARKVIPKARETRNFKLEQNKGGFVKETNIGKKDWVVTFDVASLYPSLMMSLNISPETLLGMHPGVKPEVVLAGMVNDTGNILASNGAMFDKSKKGVVPELVEIMFAERKKAKKEMLNAQTMLEKVNAEINRRQRKVN